jgi:hypothetical protein
LGFAPGGASPELQGLAQRARDGDKQAQLDLGIAYEEGLGVAVDRRKALDLYRLASVDRVGTTWIYVPATRKGASGRVVAVDLGATDYGLREAKIRLQRMSSGRQ